MFIEKFSVKLDSCIRRNDDSEKRSKAF